MIHQFFPKDLRPEAIFLSQGTMSIHSVKFATRIQCHNFFKQLQDLMNLFSIFMSAHDNQNFKNSSDPLDFQSVNSIQVNIQHFLHSIIST